MTNSVLSHPFRKAMAAATTSTSFTAKIPTTTKPAASSTRSVIDLLSPNYGITASPHLPKYVLVVPYGTDANNETLDMRLWGWNKTTDATPVWVPQLLFQIAVTLGNIDAAALEASALLADTITITYGPDELTEISPANDVSAQLLTHVRGCELLEFDFDIGTGAAANCLWRVMDEF
jgi:hypothetical protein